MSLSESQGRAEHWDEVYGTKEHDRVSWFQSEPVTSLRLLREHAAGCSVVDIGAGASVLADQLVAEGVADVTVLDVSEAALAAVQARLGDRVSYVVSDVVAWRPERAYGAWHDRAVFHFLTDLDDQSRYVGLAAEAVEPGGVLVLATFAEDGPHSCSGLSTTRWSATALADRFSPVFVLEHTEREEHVTPADVVQPFTWVVLRRS